MSYSIEGDSAEYEFLTEAVQMSAHVEGAVLEIGNRRGMGLKYLADAMLIHCPAKVLIGVDPYGHLNYEHREGQITRLDYTNQMKLEGLGAINSYLASQCPVNFVHINLTDGDFFRIYADGVPIYELERHVEKKYSTVHLDGPHSGEAIIAETLWFNERMDIGATIVIDDTSIDFVDMKPIDAMFSQLGWEQVKIGNKKAVYVKR